MEFLERSTTKHAIFFILHAPLVLILAQGLIIFFRYAMKRSGYISSKFYTYASHVCTGVITSLTTAALICLLTGFLYMVFAKSLYQKYAASVLALLDNDKLSVRVTPSSITFFYIENDEVKLMKDMLREFEGTGVGAVLDKALNMTKEVAVEDIYEEIKNIDNAEAVIFDGIISQRLVDVASKKGIKKLVAFNSMNVVKKPKNLQIITIN